MNKAITSLPLCFRISYGDIFTCSGKLIALMKAGRDKKNNFIELMRWKKHKKANVIDLRG